MMSLLYIIIHIANRKAAGKTGSFSLSFLFG